MSFDAATLDSLHRYPVKGLSPERLGAVSLATDAYFPGDRIFAIENGPSDYDEAAPRHLPKIAFLMLMRNERLAELRTRYEPDTTRLTIRRGAAVLCDVRLDDAEGRTAMEGFFAGFCADELRGAPRLRTSAPGFRFTDSPQGYVSILNLASVRAVEEAAGRPVDPLRFRANLAVSGWEPWAENAMVGRRLQVGEATLEVSKTTERCAATSVDPVTGARDMNVVKLLMQRFGHNLCGVYARVVDGGTVREGDCVVVLPA